MTMDFQLVYPKTLMLRNIEEVKTLPYVRLYKRFEAKIYVSSIKIV